MKIKKVCLSLAVVVILVAMPFDVEFASAPVPVPTKAPNPFSAMRGPIHRTNKQKSRKKEPEQMPTEPIEVEQTKVEKRVFEVTAYCPCEICCGEHADGITASGKFAMQGRTIAVDKNVIPLGSVVEIKNIGIFIAEDVGGAIKGDKIDVYFDDHEAALNFGRQYLEVEIKSEGM